MDGTWTDLEGVLSEEASLHAQLLSAAESKRAAIIHGDLPALEELLGMEQKLIRAVEAAEKRRLALVAGACAELGLQPEAAKLADLIARAGEPHADALARKRRELREVIDRLRYRTRQNAELLHASVEHCQAFLRMVAEAANPDGTYGKDGRRRRGDFSLLNRSA